MITYQGPIDKDHIDQVVAELAETLRHGFFQIGMIRCADGSIHYAPVTVLLRGTQKVDMGYGQGVMIYTDTGPFWFAPAIDGDNRVVVPEISVTQVDSHLVISVRHYHGDGLLDTKFNVGP